jgi:plastocyanin
VDLPRPLAALAALSLLAPLVAGCGGEKAVPALNRTIGVKLDEYRITPENVTAPAGTLRIIARNRGRLTHNLVIQKASSDPQATPVELGRTATLHPGERDETSITLKPGTYRMVCTIGNHDDLGQFGTLVVR